MLQHNDPSRSPGDHESVSELLEGVRAALQVPGIRSPRFLESLPFSAEDVTAGSETELQAAVLGHRSNVDLPLSIEKSNYFANVIRRVAAGDTSLRAVTDLEAYLQCDEVRIWENSWVRFPTKKLSPYAREILRGDLLSDKSKSGSPPRADSAKFFYSSAGEQWLRVPISYLIKLALADILGTQENLPAMIRKSVGLAMERLLNDNTSPETLSFHIVPLRPDSGSGRALAEETSKRFLLTELLIMYANEAFSLKEMGQEATVYFSPHPPLRQKELNECISDSFYRELFMSPCLSGWDDGLAKHAYMCLCHEVLSRSQLNAVAKLREAGIITRNLVVIPNVSNISLANNGTHISLGSIKLGEALRDRGSGFTAVHEKYIGDLVIKIVEHFLPLFVRTYSAAPYRLGFSDFHPERALGFLPHEIDYTHLRMMWRRWKRKAHLRLFGRPITPFGLTWLDQAISILFRLKGDFIPDFRLVDYLMAPMSTVRSPALDGTPGSQEKLKRDLADLGVFDAAMSLYSLYRLREFAAVGYSGFEGRYYSLFHSLTQDMARAVELQALVTALAFKYVLSGAITHRHIPDDPFVESERRQIFFGLAIGLPTFYVRSDTGNRFLKRIVRKTRGVRYSRRYPGYVRVYHRQFRLALANLIREDAQELMEMLDVRDTLSDLVARIEEPETHAASGKLTRRILEQLGASSPMRVTAEQFNLAAETSYRMSVKRLHLKEALDHLKRDSAQMDASACREGDSYQRACQYALENQGATEFLSTIERDLLSESIGTAALRKLINLVLITVHRDARESSRFIDRRRASLSEALRHSETSGAPFRATSPADRVESPSPHSHEPEASLG